MPTLEERILAVSRLTGTFKLRSGVTRTEYFDKYLFESDPSLLRAVAGEMIDLLPADCDVLAGLEMGGIPLATVMSQFTGLPTVFVRKEAKTYGTRKSVEGPSVSGLRVVIIEDVVTTGGAITLACAHLRAQGALVDTAICALRRYTTLALPQGITLEAAFDA